MHMLHKKNKKSLALFIVSLQLLYQSRPFWASAQTPPTLPPTVPVELAMILGQVDIPTQYEDTWYVPNQYYMLTKVKMWKNTANTSGFKVWFSAYPPSEFSGWPDQEHMFGFTDETSNIEEITLDSEVVFLETCVDGYPANSSPNADFEGIFFTEHDGDYQGLTPDCPNRQSWDLSQDRLIGFRVVLSLYYTGRINIRGIAPIVDAYPACLTPTIVSLTLPPLSNMLAYIAQGPDSQTFTPAVILLTCVANFSTDYGSGFTNAAFDLALSSTFSYLDLTGDTITLESALETDAPAFETITLTTTMPAYPTLSIAPTTFTVELICQVQTVALTQYSSMTYSVMTGLQQSIQTLAQQTPDCGYTETFVYNVYLSGVLIPAASFVPVSHQTGDYFGVDTNDPNDENFYDVEVIVSLFNEPGGTGSQIQDTQTFTLDIQCNTLSIAWSNEVQPTQSYIIKVDSMLAPLPANSPYSLVQTPLCAEAEYFALALTNPAGPLPAWISPPDGSNTLIVNSVDFADASDYQFTLDAVTDSGAAISTSFEIKLIDPCVTATIIAGILDNRPLFAFNDLTDVEFPYSGFTHSVQATYGLSCGDFTYTAYSSMTTENGGHNPDNWLSVDETEEVVKMNLQFLHNYYTDPLFSLTASLVDYPGVSSEAVTITLNVYNLKCIEKEDDFVEYTVSEDALLVTQEMEELPDQSLIKFISAFYEDENGVENELPEFISFDEYTTTFYVYSGSNAVTGNYTLVTRVVYADYPNTVMQCEIELVVLLPPAPLPFYINSKPYFTDLEGFSPQSAPCGQAWSYNLPEIEDPDPFNIVEITVKTGAASSFLNLAQTTLYINANVTDEGNIGTYQVQIELFDGFDKQAYELELQVFCLDLNFTIPPDSFIPRYDSPSPMPYIREITQLGQVFVWWNTTMSVPYDEPEDQPEQEESLYRYNQPSNLGRMLNETRSFNETMFNAFSDVIGLPMKNYTNYSEINNETMWMNETQYNMLGLHVIDGDQSVLDTLNFTWECIDYTENEMTLQLYFDYPMYVSITDRPQSLRLIFHDQTLFKDINGKMVWPNLELRKELPRQMDPVSGAQLQEAAELAADATKTVFASTFFVNLFLIGGLNHLLAMIQNLNIIVHMQLVNVETPANAQIFFNALLSIVAFDIVEQIPGTEEWIQESFEMPETQPVAMNFQSLGYESSLFIQNMGSIFIFYLMFPLFTGLILLLNKISQSCHNVHKSTRRILKRTFFNSMIKFVGETYLITSLCCFINLRYVLKGGVPDMNFGLSVATLLIVAGFPLLLIYIFSCVEIERIKSYSFKARVGVVYVDFNLRDGKSSLFWPITQTFEKLIIAFVLVFFERGFAQLITINFVSLFHLMTLGLLSPYKIPGNTKWELFQESIVFLVFYNLFCATDFVKDVPTRDFVGYSMIAITSFSLIADLIRLFYLNMKGLHRFFIQWNGNYQVAREIQRRDTVKLEVRRKSQLLILQQQSASSNNQLLIHQRQYLEIMAAKQEQGQSQDMKIEDFSVDYGTDQTQTRPSRPHYHNSKYQHHKQNQSYGHKHSRKYSIDDNPLYNAKPYVSKIVENVHLRPQHPQYQAQSMSKIRQVHWENEEKDRDKSMRNIQLRHQDNSRDQFKAGTFAVEKDVDPSDKIMRQLAKLQKEREANVQLIDRQLIKQIKSKGDFELQLIQKIRNCDNILGPAPAHYAGQLKASAQIQEKTYLQPYKSYHKTKQLHEPDETKEYDSQVSKPQQMQKQSDVAQLQGEQLKHNRRLILKGLI